MDPDEIFEVLRQPQILHLSSWKLFVSKNARVFRLFVCFFSALHLREFVLIGLFGVGWICSVALFALWILFDCDLPLLAVEFLLELFGDLFQRQNTKKFKEIKKEKNYGHQRLFVSKSAEFEATADHFAKTGAEFLSSSAADATTADGSGGGRLETRKRFANFAKFYET